MSLRNAANSPVVLPAIGLGVVFQVASLVVGYPALTSSGSPSLLYAQLAFLAAICYVVALGALRARGVSA